MSLEDEVRLILDVGRKKGMREHDAMRADVDVGRADEPAGEYELPEDWAWMSDLVQARARIEALNEAVLSLAQSIDALTASERS
jgi:uncharacterized protein YceH (UPF0502 family)